MTKKQLPAKRRSKNKSKRFDHLLVIGIIISAVVIALTLWGPLKKFNLRDGNKTAERAGKEQALRKSSASEETERKAGKSRPPAERSEKREPAAQQLLVAIVIDDLGQDLKLAREIISLPAPLTIAVMPNLPFSRKIAELARQNNREVLLHLPMESRNKNGKTAPGILRSDMTPMDFLSILSDNIQSVPGAIGVNNHEGSLLSENKEAMKFLMSELKARNFLFLDSMTSAKSVAHATAREFGLKAGKRDVFLDNDSENAESIRRQLEELGRFAKEHGRAIGIGHPHPATISELRKWIAAASRQGIEIVPLSKIINE